MPISSLTKVGLSVESTWGAGGSPAIIFPVEDWSLTDPYEQILDNAKRGVVAKDFNAYQGVGRAEASLEGEVFPELFGYVLRAAFGALSSAAGTPATHTFTFSGTPPSLALIDDTAVRQHEGQGMMVSELSFSFNPTEGALMYSSSMTGQQLATVSYTFPSDENIDKPFLLGWHGSVALDGTFFPVIEGEISISREVALWYQLNNTQFPGTAYADAPEITGSFTIDYTAGSDYDRYIDKSQGSVDLYWYMDANNSLKIELGSVDFGDGPVELDKSGAAITLAYTYRSLYVTALSGPARAILVCDTQSF
jgi:hypothetical protein